MIRKLKKAAKEARATWRRASVAKRLPARQVSGEPALVVAPHPDDETFGAGGMIALKRALDVPVSVIFLTDGSASLRPFPEILPEHIGRVRSEQALAACARLGLLPEHLTELGLPDGRIPRQGEPGFDDAVARLGEEIERVEPAEVYCPHPRDGLPDHEAAAGIVLTAARRANRRRRIVFYVVWGWFRARTPLGKSFDLLSGWRLDIRSVYEQKQSAVAVYLQGKRAPGGHPYYGYLPAAIPRSARAGYEVFFEADCTSDPDECV